MCAKLKDFSQGTERFLATGSLTGIRPHWQSECRAPVVVRGSWVMEAGKFVELDLGTRCSALTPVHAVCIFYD